jgi:hypothetical protein
MPAEGHILRSPAIRTCRRTLGNGCRTYPSVETAALIIVPVRHWLLVFLVLLIPLRGWVGEAMAGQMLEQVMAAHEAHAEEASHAHMHMHLADDCDEHAASASPSEPSPAGAHADCGTCAACQACSSVALSTALPPPLAATVTQPRPESVQRTYASAEPLPARKPPRR